MATRDPSGVEVGRLQSATEQLVTQLTAIQSSIQAQTATNSRLEAQLTTADERIGELRLLLNGPDGSSGLLSRLQGLEAELRGVTADLAGLKALVAESKKTLIKIAVVIFGSGAVGSAGISKILTLLGSG